MVGAVLGEVWADLVGLVLPTTCAACAADTRTPICRTCAAVLAAAAPHPVVPSPAPPGMPHCRALADYDGVLRELLIAFKERGRHDLARPLGRLLAAVVAAETPAGTRLALVGVPDTARAARQRYGDHLGRLAGHAAAALRGAGWPTTVHRALRARQRPDSVGLDIAARGHVSAQAFRVRPTSVATLRNAMGAGARLVVVDDIVTTGATLAAVCTRLAAAGLPPAGAAVLAATRRKRQGGNPDGRIGLSDPGRAAPGGRIFLNLS